MRRGIFPNCETSCKGIILYPNVDAVDIVAGDELRPHWDEFAEAIRQFTPAIEMVPDNFDRYFEMEGIAANQSTMAMIREALLGKPFTRMRFEHSVQVDFEVGGMNIDSIIRIAESNTSLRKLEIHCNRIGSDHVERLCSIAHNHPLVELNLSNSILDDGVGNVILTSLLSSQELNLEKLSMRSVFITSEVSGVLADFIATNPKLKYLGLEQNNLNDNDAVLIANALRNNTTLRRLCIGGNDFTINGLEVLKSVVFDTSSLNAVATSNHTCHVSWTYNRLDPLNTHDIDVKLLPNMLEAIQKYGNGEPLLLSRYFPTIIPDDGIKSMSIVYEVMRKWEKVFNMYESA